MSLKAFMDQDFLLETEASRILYHNYAEGRPILDYHTHLDPRLAYENAGFKNLNEACLDSDHYKWRALRTCGVPERLIMPKTDSEPEPYERFLVWAQTLEKSPGNPLWHWAHLELQRYFECDLVLNEKNAPEIWQYCNERLKGDQYRIQSLLKRQKVEYFCTTDDPVSELEYHRLWQEEAKKKAAKPCGMFPSFRPDKVFALEKPEEWKIYVQALGKSAGLSIHSWTDLLDALDRRLEYFHQQGCRISDHSFYSLPREAAASSGAEQIFKRLWADKTITPLEAEAFQGRLLFELAVLYKKRGWALQLHLGAFRQLNKKRFMSQGPDIGDDGLSDIPLGKELAAFLNRLEEGGHLGKTIVYNLNPQENETILSLLGAFQDSSLAGKLQLGPAWWFNDTREGITRHLQALAGLSSLGCFVGMLTDSRSYLSFVRHEYFRRLLCNLLGAWVEKKELPADYAWLGSLVENLAWKNAKNYFGLEMEGAL